MPGACRNGPANMSERNDKPNWSRDPGRLSQLASAIADGTLTPSELIERFIARIEEAEPHVQCWREVDVAGARAVAEERTREARAGRLRGPLHGIPAGIKDIVDVESFPTRANSRWRQDTAAASADAEIVLALRTQGAVVLGKVHTTEYAFFDPSPARNPHALDHTPGGSSSGSAAAVAAGMVPMTVGTQTVASVNRPATYCGIAAFKPSSRSMPCFGITPLAPSYDTPGFFGWSVADAVYAYQAVMPTFMPEAHVQSPRVIMPTDAHTGDMSGDVAAALERTAASFRAAGITVERRPSPISFAKLFSLQRSSMLYEAARALAFLKDKPSGQVGPKLLALIDEGNAITLGQYLDDRSEIDTMRRTFFGAMANADVFLWPATPAPAPEGLAWTGEPKYISPWTALGGPVVSMPSGLSSDRLPIGVLLAGRPGSDRAMCSWVVELAAVAERHL